MASIFCWNLALMRKTSKSRSFGMPSAPREGRLPPKICLWNIKLRIQYNRIKYDDFPGVPLRHWVKIFGIILGKSVSYRKLLWNTICKKTIYKNLNICLHFDIKYCLHLNLSLLTNIKNHIFIVYTHHFWILWSDSPFRVYEETSLVVCVTLNHLRPSSRDIVSYALQKSVTWNNTIDGIQYRWKLQLQLYTMGQNKCPSIQAITSGLNQYNTSHLPSIRPASSLAEYMEA